MTPSFATFKTPSPEAPTAGLAAVAPVPAALAPGGPAPAWLASQMPPVYRSRYEEILRLSAEIRGMDRMGRLLWEQGAPLREAITEAFSALKTKPEWSEDGSSLVVRVDSKRRVLVHPVDGDGPLQRKSDGVATAFRLLQEQAGPDDRIVLVTTGERTVAPRDRGETASPEAQDLLRRMGVNLLPATTLFNMWILSLTDLTEARTYLDLLHSQDGGSFKMKAAK